MPRPRSHQLRNPPRGWPGLLPPSRTPLRTVSTLLPTLASGPPEGSPAHLSSCSCSLACAATSTRAWHLFARGRPSPHPALKPCRPRAPFQLRPDGRWPSFQLGCLWPGAWCCSRAVGSQDGGPARVPRGPQEGQLGSFPGHWHRAAVCNSEAEQKCFVPCMFLGACASCF